MGDGMMKGEDVTGEAFCGRNPVEDEVERIKRLNEELGSSQGDDVAEQRLLQVASRWLGPGIKANKCLASLQVMKMDSNAAASFTSATVASAVARSVIPLDDRSELLAALRGRGCGSSRGCGLGRGGSGQKRTLGAALTTACHNAVGD